MTRRSLPALLLLLASAACGANMAPVLDVKDVPVVTATQGAPTTQQVRAAIVSGLAQKGWTVQSEDGLTLTAQTTTGEHSATIAIDYSSTRYSIEHLSSSEGLKYDGEYIHRRYNHWIDRLQQAINTELAEVRSDAPPEAAQQGLPQADAPPPEPIPAAEPAPLTAPAPPSPP